MNFRLLYDYLNNYSPFINSAFKNLTLIN